MATAAMDMTTQSAETLATADFQALEQRVLRAVEMLRAEREAHSAANARIADLERHAGELDRQLNEQRQHRSELEQHRAELEHRLSDVEQQLGGKSEHAHRLESELEQLQQERDQVRGRVERLLRHLDEFTV